MIDGFTRDEAEALLPTLEPLLHALRLAWDQVVDAGAEVAQMRQRMQGNGHALHEAMQNLTARFEAARTHANQLIEEIRAYGVELKDPRAGLIDFPSWRDGRLILLCWQLGEGCRIAWWHEVEAGFAGRQPLDG